ncbi:hypothetical protein L3X38_019241 [Prunus dulcis]|uniref:Transposase MuDR plant domain-containing protein n=1 Tax=Prunus dulcis TaxID=3755 RepID=A0AAD4ZAV5_PRUDU|nr:hypothetical protein L3X38_019241 [Prunus dulcis]
MYYSFKKDLNKKMLIENSEDPEFYDTAYEQSEDEQCLLEKDDRAFDNYVDHNAPDIDPAADEGEKSDDMAISDVNSLDSSSCDEVDLPMRKRKRKLPKFEDFRPKTDLNNPIFKLGIRFPSVYVFWKAVKNYSVLNRMKIKFSKNDKDNVRAVCDGIKNGKCPWFVYVSAVNGSSMVQIKSYEEEHTCGTVEHNVHANSSWLAERYATQLSRIINWDVRAFKEMVNEDLCVIASRSQLYRARQKATAISEGTYTKQFETLWDYVEELKKTNVGTILNGNHISYVHDYYKKEAFMKAYKPIVNLMASQDLWAKTNFLYLLPSKFHKQQGEAKENQD